MPGIHGTHLCRSPFSYGIKVYDVNNNNKMGRMSNMIRQYIMVSNTQREENQNSSKAIL